MSVVAGAGFGWNTRGAMWTPVVQGASRPAPSTTQPWPNLGRFRRHLNGITTDATNSPLGGMLVKWFDVATDLLVGSLTSDTGGIYDLPVYAESTYYAWIWKAGTPTVFGASDRVPAV